ncbi:DUF6941 family protein [Gordonia rubripertincta]|uniref:Uncharacterized protein n=1 Tax=Gordonia phage William TaxID=2571253 RepID=A0A4Y6EIG3_9CAUD|nr:hypothetical protein [Gordonia rubripertincta]YP_010001254.1 hypothetical protein JZX82_gp36 [Gordonia phage William]QDF17131.1 hypothetical protein SEA_WILLIAM_36 [Gordonia phage William]QMU18983.1 hypothetical protein H3V45_12760 [Gordonia rubripertincta]
MIVTGMFIAEAAETVNKKIYVRGGILDTWGVHPSTMTGQFELVMLLQASVADDGRDWNLRTEVVGPDGEVLSSTDETISSLVGDGENRGVHRTMTVKFPAPGRYVFIATVDGTTAAVPLTVHIDPSVSP